MPTTADSATARGRDDAPGRSRSAVGAQAVAKAIASNSVDVEIPGIGRFRLPSLDQIAFLGGIAALAVLELIEWPVAMVLAAGHILARNRHHVLLREFGEALDKA
jgi:hypothetical protein